MFARQSGKKFASQIGRVHHPLGLRLHGMSGDAIDDDLGRVARKSFPADFSGCAAVQSVSNVCSERAQIEFVHAATNLLVESETDSNEPVLPLPLLEQSLD